MSRVYLYQQQYDLAVTYADSVLGSSYSLLDFNQYDKVGPNYATSPETIFTMGTNGYYYYMDAEDLYETGNFKISSSLQASYGVTITISASVVSSYRPPKPTGYSFGNKPWRAGPRQTGGSSRTCS